MNAMHLNDYLKSSVQELFNQFPNAESARKYFERLRWNGSVVCPHCSADTQITARKGKRAGYYCCGACKEEFSVRTNSIFEHSRIPLHKWIYAIYLTVSSRHGISSTLLSKQIGVTQKTAWNMQARIREAHGDSTEDENQKNFESERKIIDFSSNTQTTIA